MDKTEHRKTARWLNRRKVLSILLSAMLLCGNLSGISALAQDTQYFNANGWVVLAPTATPAVTAAPEGTVQTVTDGITFAVTPAADSPALGAQLTVERVTDEDALNGAKAAYQQAFGEADAAGAELRLYRLHFSAEGKDVGTPANCTLNVFATADAGFVPVCGMPFQWRDSAATLGEAVKVSRTNDAWQTAVVLPDTDTVLLATRAKAEATPQPSAAPQAGTYTYEDGAVSLSATVGGSLPPEGAEFFVEDLGATQVPAPDGGLRSLLAYRVGFRTAEGELGADAPLNVRLTLLGNQPDATLLTNAQGDVLWQQPDGETAAPPASFDFALAVGDSFILAGTQPAATAEPTEQTPQAFTYEDDTVKVVVTVADGVTLPENTQFDASVTQPQWADVADRLTAQGVTEAAVKQLLSLSASFTADGAPVDMSAARLTYDVLLKGTQYEGALAWVLDATAARQADGFAQTADGFTAQFTAVDGAAQTLAIAGQPAAPLVYEDDTLRVTFAAGQDKPLPDNTRLDATAAQGVWKDYAKLLQGQGFDETRVQQLQQFTAAFTLDGVPMDIAEVPLTCAVLLKGEQFDGSQAWAILPDGLVAADSFTATEQGALATFTLNGQTPTGFAVTLPGRTVYTYEDDQVYVVATLSDPSAVPEGAQLTVKPVAVDDTLKPYVDLMEQTQGQQPDAQPTDAAAAPQDTAPPSSLEQTADTAPTGQGDAGKLVDNVYSAYDIHFELDGKEYEPASGTVNVSITYKNSLADSGNLTDVSVLHLKESDGQVSPEQLPAQLDTQNGSDTVSFNTKDFSVYLIQNGYAMSSALTYTLIDTAGETFTNTGYYNANRVLGVAGNFHLVAFGTATLNAHTNGNVLAQNLAASSNFGTNNVTDELSYIQNYTKVNGNSASSTKHVLALGSANTVSLADNGLAFAVNGTKIDKPYNIYQDNDTSALPFINLATVKSEVQSISSMIAGYSDANVTTDFTDMNNRSIIVNTAGGLAVYNTTASTLNGYSANPLNVLFASGSTSSLIVNVNCSGSSSFTLPDIYMWVGSTRVAFSETGAFTNGRVLFNFINSNGATITSKLMFGSMLAPGATVTASQNLNGTVVATDININAESHRDDYVGKLTDSVSVRKAWKDASGNVLTGSGIPSGATATVQLYRKQTSTGTVSAFGSPVTLDSSNGYAYTWTGLDKVSYTYTVAETAVNGEAVTGNATSLYTVTYDNNGGISSGAITVTNQQKATVSLAVTKVWKDADGTTAFSGTTPAVTIQLKQNGNNYGSTVTLNSANGYAYSFTNLPKYSSGTTAYIYTVAETSVPDGFDLVSVTYGTNTATVTNKVESTSIGVTKAWSDSGTHPGVTVNLLRNGSLYKTQTLPINTSTWNYTFTNLPVGVWTSATNYTAYTYTVTENSVTGYTGAVTGSAAAGFTITNTVNNTGVTVTKTWAGDAGNTGNRPASLSLTLKRKLADGTVDSAFSQAVTVTAAAGWSAAVSGLAKGYYTVNGTTYAYQDYTYFITEPAAPAGYVKTESGTGVTNTFQTTLVKVTKVWLDDPDGDGTYTAPANTPAVTVYVKNGATVVDSHTFAAGTSSLTWESKALPKFDVSGNAIAYTVTEDSVAGYALTGPAYGTYAGGATATLTNTYQRINVNASKTWDLRSTAETVVLPAVTYSLYNVASPTGSDTPISTTTVPKGSAASAYSVSFKNLPKYNASGAAIAYSVTETCPQTYTTTRTGTYGAGFAFVNTLVTVDVSGAKTWVDGAGAAYTGYRPAITVKLLRNGSAYDSRNFAAVTSGAANYAYTFTNLPKYDPDGNLYAYTVQEPSVSGFTGAVSGYNITNTLGTTSVKVTKVWNNSGYTGTLTRPAITVYLLNGADKNTVANPAASHTFPTGAGSYEYTFTNLPAGYYNGSVYQPYAYTVAESSAYGYVGLAPTGSAAAGYSITNTLQTVSVSVAKNWVLATGVTSAPEIVVTLKRGGTVVDTKTIAAGAANRSDYAWTWASLPKTDPATGSDYDYTVEETISGGAGAGFAQTVSYDRAISGVLAVTLTNTQKTVSLSGVKTWLDEQGNTYASGLNRPAFTVTLYQNGVKFAPEQSKAFAANAANTAYSFTGLPAYDQSGNPYAYTVRESAMAGFTAAYATPAQSGGAVTANMANQLNKTALTVNKQWLDNGADVTDSATRAVTVQLTRKADNESGYSPVSGRTAVLDSTGTPAYQATFDNLPAGMVDTSGTYHAYTYSVAEQSISGYTSAVGATDVSNPDAQNLTVTNTRGRIAFSVTKQWLAAGGSGTVAAPVGATVTVQLMQSVGGASPTEVSGRSVTLNGVADPTADSYESAAWKAVFADLEQFTTDGAIITYSARETASTGAKGFWGTVQSVSATAFTIQNHQTALYVSKVDSAGGAALAGAAFSITNTADSAETYTLAGGALITDWTKLGLTADTVYRLSETVTPKGYLTAADVSFKISAADGKVYVSTDNYAKAQAGNRITVANEPIDLKVAKLNVNVATVTGAELATAYAGNFVTGAVLKLYASDDLTKVLQTVTVSANAFYTLDHSVLEKGKAYVLMETTTPAGYKTANPVTFTVGSAANGTIYGVYDAPLTYKTIEVQKTWGSGSTPRDIIFDLYMNGGSTPIESVTLPAADSDGKIAFAGTASIAVGGKYPTADENGTAIAYTVAERGLDGYVASAMTQTQDATTIHNQITNTPVTVGFSKKTLVGTDELPGATLTLTDVTGTPAQVEQWVSGATPHVVAGKLVAGHTYTLAETAAPNGYALTQSVTFRVKADGTVEAVGTLPDNADASGGSVTLRDSQLTLTVSKKAVGGGAELPGASLTLTDTTLNQPVAAWVGGSAAKTFASTVSASGAGTVIDGLHYTFPQGQSYPLIAGHSYQLTETAAPAGYLLANAVTFTIATDGTITNVSANGENSGTTVTLRDEANAFTLYKTDASGAKLAGATFELYLYSDAAADQLGARVFADQTITTGADGSYTLRGLTNGQKYVLHETAAPVGFDLAADTVFTYLDSQQAVPFGSVTVADDRASLKLRKVGPDGAPVAGATLAIYNAARTTKLWEGVSIAPTGDNPDAWLSVQAALGQADASRYLVKGGSYYLHEEAAPDGYELRGDYVAFTFGEGGATALSFADGRLSLNIGKVDIVGGSELAGATLRITDDTDSGRLVEEWTTAVDADGAVQPHAVPFESLKAGHAYTLTEVTAPDGYLRAQSVQFTIANNGTVTLAGANGSLSGNTITMTDARTSLDIRKTGVGGAAIASGVGFSLYQSDAAGTLGAQIGAEGLAFERLAANGYYWLTETAVPDGYVAMAPLHFQFRFDQATGNTSLVFDTRADVAVTSAAGGKVAIVVSDAPTAVTVRKVDGNNNALAGAVLSIHTDSAGAPGAEVSGTRFTTQADNASTPDDESLHAYTGVLLRGQTYWLVEESAPANYALASPVRFTVNSDATTVALTMENLPLELLLYKLDSDATDASGAYTGNKVTGVTLTLTGPYLLGGVTEANHMWTWSTATDNPKKLTMADGLVPGGVYTLHEDPDTVPATNTVAEDMTFTLPAGGGAVTRAMVDAPIGGVSLKVIKAFAAAGDGTALAAGELPASVTVNLMRGLLADGSDAVLQRSYPLTAADSWTHTFAGLPKTDTSGKTYVYTVAENAVDGFTLTGIGSDTDPGDNFAYTVTNKANEGTFSKRTISGDELSGAKMRILDSKGNLVAEWVSANTPYVLRGKLNPNSDYTLEEVSAPAGYLVSTSFAFHMDNNLTPTVTGITYGGVDGGVVYMTDSATTVTLSKRAVGGGSELVGASLTLSHKDSTGATVTDTSWVSGTTAKTIQKLAVGTEYTLTEVRQPNGYLVAENINFIIQADGSVKAKQAAQPASDYATVSGNTVVMLDAPTAVTLSKQAVGGGAELTGATLTVTHEGADGKPITDATWVSGKNDSGDSTNLPRTINGLVAGVVYTFTETAAPYGYTVAESIQFVIDKNGAVGVRKPGDTDFTAVDAGTVIMKDKPTQVTFSKQSITGGSELPGAHLTLTDITPAGGQPTTVWSWVSTDTPHTITGELIAGHTYTFVETTSPAGYTVAETITFTVGQNGAVSATNAGGQPVDNGSGVVDSGSGKVTMKDAPTVLTLTKVDDQTPAKPVKNATLSVYTASGADATAPGALVATVSTGETGTATVTGVLSLGAWYIAAETGTPDGYVTAQPSAPFQLLANGTKGVSLTDPRTVFYVGKRDAQARDTLLGGATLVVYDSKTVGGTTAPDTAVTVATVNTVAGQKTPVYGLQRGHTYYLYEAGAPAGYLRDTATYTAFTIADDGSTEVYSYDPQTTVSLNKTDAAGKRLAGAGLALVKGNGTGYAASDVITSFTSSATADETVRGLLIGQVYTLVETAAPEGYVLKTTGVSFQLNNEGKVVAATGSVTDASTVSLVSLVNTPSGVTFSKRATGAGTAELAGATLTISHRESGSEVVDDTWVSGDIHHRDAANNPIAHVVNGKLKADGVTEYTFTEVAAPAGYTVAGSIVFRIAADGTVQVKQPDGSFAAAANSTVVMTDAPIRFRVAKVDSVSGAYLAGAEFRVAADAAGQPAATSVAGFERIVSGTAPITVSGLPAGNYWLVETKAPQGTDAKGNPVYYQTAAPVGFTVSGETLADSALVTVTVADTPTTVTALKLDSLAVDANGTPTGNRVKNATLTLTRKADGALLGTHTFDGVADWVLDSGLLEPGKVYVLTESVVNTPDGYLAAYSQEFMLAADGSDRWIIVDDPIPPYHVVVNKQWKDSLANHAPVTVDLYRSDNASIPYGTAVITAPATSASFDNLPSMGKDHTAYTYTLKERAVDGYLPGVLSAPVTSADGKTFTYTLVNTPTTLAINKVAADTGNSLPGAKLALVKGDGTAYTAADVVEEWTSGTDGTNADGSYKPHTITGKLAVGAQYTLVETAAPVGYLKADKITFTVGANGTNSFSGTNAIAMQDAPVTLRFAKLDNLTHKLVAGAKFSVYDDAQWQANAATATPVYTFTSQTKYVEVSGLFKADTLYRLVETAAPDGYQLNGTTLQFRTPVDATAITVQMSNPRIYHFAKVSASTGKAVPGATLSVTDAAGNVVISPWTSTASPYEFVNSDASGAPILKTGVTYRLVETAAPSGYALNTAAVTFQLGSDGLIGGGTTVTMTNTPQTTPKDDTVDLTIRKTWVDHSNAGNTRPTAGLTVNVYRKLSTDPETAYIQYLSVTVPARAGNAWYLTIQDLARYNASGVEYNYRAREVVPTGYTVTYTNNGFTMVNTYPNNDESPTPTPVPTITPTPPATTPRIPTNVKYVDGKWVYIDDNNVPLGVVPQTGDESDYVLWGLAIVLPLLLSAIAGMLVYRRRRKQVGK